MRESDDVTRVLDDMLATWVGAIYRDITADSGRQGSIKAKAKRADHGLVIEVTVDGALYGLLLGSGGRTVRSVRTLATQRARALGISTKVDVFLVAT